MRYFNINLLTIITFGLLILPFCSQSQKIKFPNFLKNNFSQEENIKDWKILVKAPGDLNLDGINDLVVIYESIIEGYNDDRCESGDTAKYKPRILVVYIKEGNELKPLVQNNQFIASSDEGGMVPDLTPTLRVFNGFLKISYQFVRSQASYDFKFKEGKMELIAANMGGVTSAGSGDTEFVIYNFEESTIITIKGNISKDETDVQTQHFKLEYPMSLDKMKCMFSWEILPDKFL